MKLQRYTRHDTTAWTQMLVGMGMTLAPIVAGCAIASAILLLMKQPLAGIGTAALCVLGTAGIFGGLFNGKSKRWIGTLITIGILCTISLIMTKGHAPISVLLGYGVYLGSYFLSSLLPKKAKKKRRYK